jgi:ADP-heptose:LPS heptosyltransferase
MVFRALYLGDLLCATPALRALRAWSPRARITLAGLEWARDFAARYPHWIDEFATYPANDGFLDGRSQAMPAAFIRDQRGRHDLAIQLHGSGLRSNALVAALDARRCAGFHPPDQPAPGRDFIAWRESEPEAERWLRLLRHLGAPAWDAAPELPLAAEELQHAQALLAQQAVAAGSYVCLHPGAKLTTRRWPLQRFAEVGRALDRQGLRLLVTGTAPERRLTAALASQLHEAGCTGVVDLGGRTSLGVLAAVVSTAALVVSNDTGMSHVAAAMRTPSVIISSGGDARRWAPADRRLHRVLAHAVSCRPCEFETCPYDHACAAAISVDAVLAAAAPLIGGLRDAA